MTDRDAAALDGYPLVPRLLHDVHDVDSSLELLGVMLTSPIIPLETARPTAPGAALTLVAGELLLEPEDQPPGAGWLPVLRTERMAALMPKVRKLSAREVPGLVLDVRGLGETPPFGGGEWRPRTREDLAELRAAAGCPLWLLGVCSPADAEVAAEAGLEAIIVHSGAGGHLGAVAAIEVLPEVFDAVAGMLGIYAGGPVRSGIDVFRYLAVGAEAVITESDRALAKLEAELHYAMRLTGCATLADIGYEAIFVPLFDEV